jgi:hypothetical protein
MQLRHADVIEQLRREREVSKQTTNSLCRLTCQRFADINNNNNSGSVASCLSRRTATTATRAARARATAADHAPAPVVVVVVVVVADRCCRANTAATTESNAELIRDRESLSFMFVFAHLSTRSV